MKKKILFLFLIFCVVATHAQQVTRGELFNLFHSAQKAQKESRIGDAIDIYKKISELVPALPEPYLAMGVLYSVEGESQNNALAIQAYKKYVELVPEEASTAEIRRLLEELEEQQPALAESPSGVDGSEEEFEPELDAASEGLIIIEDDDAEEEIDDYADVEEIEAVSESDDADETEISGAKVIVIEAPDDEEDDIYIPSTTPVVAPAASPNVQPASSPEKEEEEVEESSESASAGTQPLNEKEKKELIKRYRKTADRLYEDGRIEQSIRYYEKILELDNNNMEAIKSLGEIYSTSYSFSNLQKSRSNLQSYLNSIDFGNKDYDIVSERIRELDYRISNYSDSKSELAYFKSLEGIWISSQYLSDCSIPIWAFNIQSKNDFNVIELHKGSVRYSKETYSRMQAPVIHSDSIIQVRFTTGGSDTPSITEYVIESFYMETTDPTNTYLSGDKKTGNTNERKKRFEQHSNLLHSSIGNIGDNNSNVDKTFDEFIIRQVSENHISAICIETSYRNTEGNSSDRRDTMRCDFYRLPNNQPVIFLGRDSRIITGNFHTNQQSISKLEDMVGEYAKYYKRVQSGKNVNQTKLKYPFSEDKELSVHLLAMQQSSFLNWYSKETTKSRLKWMGGSLLSVASVAAGVTGLGNISNDLMKALSETLYNTGRTSVFGYISNAGDMLAVNPSVWNKNMYNSLVQSQKHTGKENAAKGSAKQ